MRRFVLVFALCALSTPALAGRKNAPPPEDAVRAFLAQVDAMALDPSLPSSDLVGFTMDEQGAGMVAEGAAGWQRVQGILAGWKADEGTIRSVPTDVRCWEGGDLATCATRFRQELQQAGETVATLEVRGTFLFRRSRGGWELVHWHESAPTAPVEAPTPSAAELPTETPAEAPSAE